MRHMFAAIGVAIVAQFGMALASSPFDGDWTGTTSKGSYVGEGRCPTLDMTLTVADGKVSGRAGASSIAVTISGDVVADGSFKGTSSFSKPLEGKFSGDMATGTFETPGCGTVTFSLERAK